MVGRGERRWVRAGRGFDDELWRLDAEGQFARWVSAPGLSDRGGCARQGWGGCVWRAGVPGRLRVAGLASRGGYTWPAWLTGVAGLADQGGCVWRVGWLGGCACRARLAGAAAPGGVG
ncbi:hypothetical protein GCM10009565_25340 [Amycolatopsis albidoflavus]